MLEINYIYALNHLKSDNLQQYYIFGTIENLKAVLIFYVSLLIRVVYSEIFISNIGISFNHEYHSFAFFRRKETKRLC